MSKLQKLLCTALVSYYLSSSAFRCAAAGAGGTLFGITPFGTNPDLLFTIDPTTGAGTAIGNDPVGFSDLTSLAFNSSGTLFGYDTDDDILLTIDLDTGLGTEVTQVGLTGLSTIAFDSNDTLFGYDVVTEQLVTIDTTTGQVQSIGIIEELVALAFDPWDTLFGVANSGVPGGGPGDLLVTISPLTGETTRVGTGSIGFVGISALTADSSGNLFAANLVGDSRDVDQLIAIDPITGVGEVVGNTTGFGFVTGLAFLPVPEPENTPLLASFLALIGVSKGRQITMG